MTHTLGAKTPRCSPDLRAISKKGTVSGGFPLVCSKAGTNNASHGPFCPLSPEIQPMVPSQGRLHRSLTAPFPREAGSVPSACCCLQPTGRLTLLSLPLLPACLTSSSARPVFGLFSLFKYRQDVYLVVVLEQFLKIFPVLCFVFPS